MTRELGGILTILYSKVLLRDELLCVISTQFFKKSTISKNYPLLGGSNYLEFKTGPNAWLIKAGEPSIAEKWLQMGIEVNLIVLRILKSMKPRRISNIRIDESNLDLIGFANLHFRDKQVNLMLRKKTFLLSIINLEISDLLSMKIKEKVFSSLFDGQIDNQVALISLLLLKQKSQVVRDPFDALVSQQCLLVSQMVGIGVYEVGVKHTVLNL